MYKSTKNARLMTKIQELGKQEFLITYYIGQSALWHQNYNYMVKYKTD